MKQTIEISKFVESIKFINNINNIKITNFDFSSIFIKDLKIKDKRKLQKQFENLETLLISIILLKNFHLELGAEFNEECKKLRNE